jgi:hypothetical protein
MDQSLERHNFTDHEFVSRKQHFQLEEMFRYALDYKKGEHRNRTAVIKYTLYLFLSMAISIVAALHGSDIGLAVASWSGGFGVLGSGLFLFEAIIKQRSYKAERLSGHTSTLPFDDKLRVKASIQKGSTEVIIYERIVSMDPGELANAELEAQLALEEASELRQTIIDQRVVQRALSSRTKTNWD